MTKRIITISRENITFIQNRNGEKPESTRYA